MAEILALPGVKGAFAIGVSWLQADRVPSAGALRAEAAKMGRWGAVCTGKSKTGPVLIGLCNPIEGTKANRVRPLAPVIASAHSEPWMRMFKLARDRYWLIAVGAGQMVLPLGDKTGTREQLSTLMARHRTKVPGLVELEEGSIDDLVLLVGKQPISKSKRTNTLKVPAMHDVAAAPMVSAVVVGGTSVTIVAALVGGWLWLEHEQEVERQAVIAKQRADDDAKKAEQAAKQQILPWTLEALPSDVLGACESAWDVQPLADKGWKLGDWHCKPNAGASLAAVNLDWIRDGGVAADAPGALSTDGKSSSDSWSMPADFSARSASAVQVADARNALWTFAQARGLKLDLPPAPPPPPPPQPGQNAPAPEPWVRMTAEITFPYAPWPRLGFAEGLDEVPGMRITDVSFDAQSKSWKVSGTLYAVRPGVPAAGK